MDLLKSIWEKVSGLYLPSPEAALRARPYIPVDDPGGNRRQTTVPALAAVTPQRIWQSRSLDTKGLTLQNAWISIVVDSDGTANEGMTLEAVLEGAWNSPYAEIARTAVVYTGPGSYVFPLLFNPDSLAIDIRAAIEAIGDDNDHAITYRVFGVLAAGYRF